MFLHLQNGNVNIPFIKLLEGLNKIIPEKSIFLDIHRECRETVSNNSHYDYSYDTINSLLQ